MSVLIISEPDSALNALFKALEGPLDASFIQIYTGRPKDPSFTQIGVLKAKYEATIQILDPIDMFKFPGYKNIAIIKQKPTNSENHMLKSMDKVLTLKRPFNSSEYVKKEVLFQQPNESFRIYYEECENAYNVLKTYFDTFGFDEDVILYYVGNNFQKHAEYIKSNNNYERYPKVLALSNTNYTQRLSIIKNSNISLSPSVDTEYLGVPSIYLHELRKAWYKRPKTSTNNPELYTTDSIISEIKCALGT